MLSPTSEGTAHPRSKLEGLNAQVSDTFYPQNQVKTASHSLEMDFKA